MIGARGQSSGSLRGTVLLAVALWLWAGADPLLAQSVDKGFAAFAANSDEPIDIESDQLDVDDAAKLAVFSGNVKAVQGAMTMHSKLLRVKYSGGEGSLGSGSQITNIKAEGKVLIVTGKDQNATSDWADFDVSSQVVVIGGNVVLSQGENVIKGDRLVINLKTGQSRFENTGDPKKRKRVRGLFMPKQSDKKKNDGAASGWAPSLTRTPSAPR